MNWCLTCACARTCVLKVVLCGDFNVAMSQADCHPTFKHEDIYSERELQVGHNFISCSCFRPSE